MPPKVLAQKYKKLEHRQHVLERHGMYIGSIEKDPIDTWVLDAEGKRMEKRRVEYIPGLAKIFGEILGNAIDHWIRQKDGDSPVKSIKVSVDRESGVVSVANDGAGIEVAKHPEHDDIYIPELIFGNLLTSTNYDDDVERIVQGTNGIGGKAANIFSTWFEVETVDAERGLKYKQRFEDNMSVIKKPSITKVKGKPHTTITFLPDYARFSLPGGRLSDDMYEVFRKQTYDACAVTDKTVAVSFNGAKLDVPNFERYVDLYLGPKADHTRVHETIDDRWEIVASYNDFGGFEQVSFVNGVLTLRGGKHVDYILGQIVKKITELLTKKHKDANIKPHTIKDNLFLFIKCTISNPTFDSQTKETLTTAAAKFGSKPEVSAAFVTKLFKSGIEQRIMDLSAIADDKTLKKTDGKKSNTVRGIVKLEDAAWAGGPKSGQCTLILTEGDSAATMAIAGLAEVGRERFGVFPLKGKVMNVKDATVKKISENEEINNIKKILGLESGKTYKGTGDLRYGQLMLMTDSDSVTGDTPLLLRSLSNQERIHIKSIEELGAPHTWRSVGSREYNKTDLEVWTDQGWTGIEHIMRHFTTKRLYRVVTPAGCVDVTEDHSLLDEAGNMIKPGQCGVGTRLLRAFPRWLPILPQDQEEEEDAKAPINGTMDERKRYLAKNTIEGAPTFTGNKMRAMELYYLYSSVGVEVRVDCDHNGIYSLCPTGPKGANAQPVGSPITAIYDLGVTRQYVYDLETHNHHFHAGVGEMIVHNTDGSHIKGLVFNLFHAMWPSLVRDPDSAFMTSMLTPIIKARRRDETLSFYNMADYDKWYASPAAKQPGWKIKYYKGLGTSTNAEAREYFKDMRRVTYKFDGEASDRSMDLAFNKKLADDRKQWLSNYDKNNILDYTRPEVSYEEFVGQELIHFSNYDLERSLPSMCDGLKISQRKIMYACFKRPALASEEIKVAQLAGYVSETSAYHHGEASLQQAIVGLAQDFVGSNNLNLLEPHGQFGCLAPDTEVLAWSGARIRARDVRIGDLLVGDDGQPRRVINTVAGVDEMYEIRMVGHESFEVNSEHILTLFSLASNAVVDIKLADLLRLSPSQLSMFKGIKNQVPVQWQERHLPPIEPYSLAAWLADEPENEACSASIPDDYLYGAPDVRELTLLGFLEKFWTRRDSSGDVCVSHTPLILDQLQHLAGSLGYPFTRLQPDFLVVQNKHGALALYDLEIVPKGLGRFNGWQIDGNERFLLADWTVTHNSRQHGGKDASQPRYIFTQLAPHTPLLFNKDDAATLTYVVDDGQKVEPEFYVPIIPMILVNGAIGIGTGFSTNIPCYNPAELVKIIKGALASNAPSIDPDTVPQLDPWYRGFNGEIKSVGAGKYVSVGKWKREGENKVHVTELPLGTWTQDYKEDLEKLLDEAGTPLKKYENRSTSERIDIVLHFAPGTLAPLLADKAFENKFGLVSSKGLTTTNMYAFNTANQITKYAGPAEILTDFYAMRLAHYQKRKEHMLAALESNAALLENKRRFVKAVVDLVIPVYKLKKDELEAQLASAKPAYAKHPQDGTYDYLTRIPIYNFTKDKVAELEAEVASAKSAAATLKGRTVHSLWQADLDALAKKLTPTP